MCGHSDIKFEQNNAQHGANIPYKQTNSIKIQLSLAQYIGTPNNLWSNISTETTKVLILQGIIMDNEHITHKKDNFRTTRILGNMNKPSI